MAVSAVLVGAALVLGPSAPDRAQAAGGEAPSAMPVTPIEHVILIMKENRSFDHYFGRFPGANGATSGEMSDGTIVPLGPAQDSLPNDIGHGPNDFRKAYNQGENNGFDLERGAFSKEGENLPYTQMDPSSLPNYWAYAARYGLGDNMFSDFHGASFANNLYQVAAQAGRWDPALDYRSVWTVPKPRVFNNRWGCDSPPRTTVDMISPTDEITTMFPCYRFRALPNILGENGVSWAMYSAEGHASFKHNALDATRPVRYDPDLWSNVKNLATFFTDLSSDSLPAVSWLIPKQTEHPPESACKGENETVSYINAVMESSAWSSTAIFVVWDEWGGFYDHVPPPQIDNISYGFRVPLIAISPWTKYGGSPDGGYMSSVFYTHASFIRSVENNWSLPSLGAADVTANGFSDFFEFDQAPKAPLVLAERECPSLSAEERRVRRRVMETRNPD